MRARAGSALACALCAAIAGAAADEEPAEAPAPTKVEVPPPPPSPDAVLRARALGRGLAGARSFLRANVQDANGAWAYVHFAPSDVPIRIAIGLPKDPPRNGSRADGREAALNGMRAWVRALRPYLPWFAVDFVESDPDPTVKVDWRRRMTGGAAGRGSIGYRIEGGKLVVRGVLALSTRPDPRGPLLSTDEVELLVAHEFGHALGLSHCLDCDSAMNYSWETRKRVYVTANDVKTYLHLLAQPNGIRHEGGPLAGLTRTGWSLADAPQR